MGQSLEREIVMKTAFDLKGRRAVISAGASGIGYAIADAFVCAGASVYICDVDGDALVALDALVNNAGIGGPTGPI